MKKKDKAGVVTVAFGKEVIEVSIEDLKKELEKI